MTDSVSICMATYNGALFIKDQLDSILLQMCNDDELIICDDCSTDNTVEIIKLYEDSRIRLYTNIQNIGHVKNFEKAIKFSTKDLIALSDQDDVWYPNRLQEMKSALVENSYAKLVASNFDTSDANLNLIDNSICLNRLPKNKIARIVSILVGKAPYFGCTFLMTRELVSKIIPFPPKLEAHDIWISLLANTYDEVIHLNHSTLCRRLHDSNLTPSHRRSMIRIVKSRALLLNTYFFWLIRVGLKKI
jgi:glycosyltransferase involved in cell wall biosynthesis